MLDGLLRACREADELVAMVVGIFVYLVDVAEVAVIGKLQVWRYEQEGVTLVVKHVLRDVLACLRVLDAEVVDRWHISLFCLHSLAVDELPGGVGVVVYRKLLSLSVLLQDEGGVKLGLFGSLRNLHSLGDVRTDVVWAEIKLR